MSPDEPDRADEPTQQTPTGYTIPVPSREDVEDALRRVAQPAKPEPSRRRRRSPKKK